MGTLIVLLVSALLYFIPVLVALGRLHHNTLAIFMLNLFLGWTLLGWVGALVWACTAVQAPAPVLVVQNNPPLIEAARPGVEPRRPVAPRRAA